LHKCLRGTNYSFCAPAETLKMADTRQLSIDLPAPLADAVRRAVETGEYASVNEVVGEALRLWASHRQLNDLDLDILRQCWDDGKASGRAGRLDIRRLIAEERAKLESGAGGGG
jgi:antitoxin ParD1/3/4